MLFVFHFISKRFRSGFFVGHLNFTTPTLGHLFMDFALSTGAYFNMLGTTLLSSVEGYTNIQYNCVLTTLWQHFVEDPHLGVMVKYCILKEDLAISIYNGIMTTSIGSNGNLSAFFIMQMPLNSNLHKENKYFYRINTSKENTYLYQTYTVQE